MQSLLHYRDVDPDLCIVLYRGVVRIRLTSVYRSYCVKEVHTTHHVSNTHEDKQLGPQRTRVCTLKSSSVVDGSLEHNRSRNRILQLYQAGHGAIHRTSLSLPRGKFRVIVFG